MQNLYKIEATFDGNDGVEETTDYVAATTSKQAAERWLDAGIENPRSFFVLFICRLNDVIGLEDH